MMELPNDLYRDQINQHFNISPDSMAPSLQQLVAAFRI